MTTEIVPSFNHKQLGHELLSHNLTHCDVAGCSESATISAVSIDVGLLHRSERRAVVQSRIFLTPLSQLIVYSLNVSLHCGLISSECTSLVALAHQHLSLDEVGFPISAKVSRA